jgi:undecaprenyl-phosphate 4-deoxy-4-formamido-L-arabinose transferase
VKKYRIRSPISIVIPVFNNDSIIADTIATLENHLSKCFEFFEMIFVDDASTDQSLTILRAAAQENQRLRILEHKTNLGQQRALTTGMLAATGVVAVGIDADLPCSLSVIDSIVQLALEDFELVLCRRTMPEIRVWWRTLGSRLVNRLSRILHPVMVEDFGCSTAAVRRELIERFRKTVPRLLILKLELLMLAKTHIEIPIKSSGNRSDQSSGYSIWKLSQLVAIMFIYVFRMRVK